MQYRVRDWGKYKHFKDRNAPWIKLNKDLLSNRDWFDLPADIAKTLVMLWLVASEDPQRQGNLPNLQELAFRFRIDEAGVRKHLDRLGEWLEQTDTEKEESEPEALQTDNVTIPHRRQRHTTGTSMSRKPAKQPINKKAYERHEYSSDFIEFWDLYPKNQHKQIASMVFEEITRLVPVAKIITGLKQQLESTYFTKDPKHFTNAENWLKQRRWEKKAPRTFSTLDDK